MGLLVYVIAKHASESSSVHFTVIDESLLVCKHHNYYWFDCCFNSLFSVQCSGLTNFHLAGCEKIITNPPSPNKTNTMR